MTTSDRPTMDELRGLPKFPFEQFDESSAPMMVLNAFQTILSDTMPQDPTEDFYVGIEWTISLLYTLAMKGTPIIIPLLGDLGLSVIRFRESEENPFEDRLLFDSELKTEKTQLWTHDQIDRLLAKLKEMREKEQQ